MSEIKRNNSKTRRKDTISTVEKQKENTWTRETTPFVLGLDCMQCLLKRQANVLKDIEQEDIKTNYFKEVMRILSEAKVGETAPIIVARFHELHQRYFGRPYSFEEIKEKYNLCMLEKEAEIREKIINTADPLKTALIYARVGNYIDFGALGNVTEDKLLELMERVETETLDEMEYDFFQQDLEKAEKLAYLTDNCGEIVLDKLLIEQLKESYPRLEITVIVRGDKVLNDATIEDAKMTGITKLVKVIGNGTQVAGTDLNSISKEAMAVIEDADLILSKGQGNFETLNGCQKNIYYLFLCKCEWFVKRFGLKHFEGVFINDHRLS